MYLGATGMSAFVRFVARVCTDVLLQMRQLCKLALTNFTPENLKRKKVKNRYKHIFKKWTIFLSRQNTLG